jgi:hypothetical protein
MGKEVLGIGLGGCWLGAGQRSGSSLLHYIGRGFNLCLYLISKQLVLVLSFIYLWSPSKPDCEYRFI